MPTGSRTEVEKRPRQTVDPNEEPSADWGWHGHFPVATQVIGWFVTLLIFLMLIGNQVGHVEDIWLVCIGAGLVILLLIDLARKRRAWRG
ncbi:MAG TPA: DUF2631 domain-containing protein [Pseudonocardiaceae bacterium]